MDIANQAIADTFARAQRQYDRMAPAEFAEPKTQGFFDLMSALHDQIESDKRASQDISTAFVEAQFDAADDNVLMFRAMAPEFSDADVGKYVRLLMLKVARERV